MFSSSGVSVCLPACLSQNPVCLSVCLPVCLCPKPPLCFCALNCLNAVHGSIDLSVLISVCLFVCVGLSMYVCLSKSASVHAYVCLSVCLSACVSVRPSVWLWVSALTLCWVSPSSLHVHQSHIWTYLDFCLRADNGIGLIQSRQRSQWM